MDCTKSTQGSCTYYKTKKQNVEFISSEFQQDQTILPEPIEVDLSNMPKKCYKTQCKGPSGQNYIKHGHRVYTVYRSQEDLTMFCLSLLQFQAIFPLRFFMVEDKQKTDRQQTEKTVWFQTQFLSLTNTATYEMTKTIKLENQVYKFFTEFLIPVVAKFKSEKMSWSYMTSQDYTDEKVIQQFQEVIKKINDSFRATCQVLN